MEHGIDFEGERKRLTRKAWKVTSAYALVLLILALSVLLGDEGVDRFRWMKPNEVGDLLAGVAGPVAFIWLVYGYFLQGIAIRQQSEELKQNTHALKLQAGQLTLLVNAENDQKELMRDSLSPHFQIYPVRWVANEFYFLVRNVGVAVSNLVITGSEGFGNFQDRSCSALGRDQEITIRTNLAKPRKLDAVSRNESPYWVAIRYECANGLKDERIYDHDDEPHTEYGRFVARERLRVREKK